MVDTTRLPKSKNIEDRRGVTPDPLDMLLAQILGSDAMMGAESTYPPYASGPLAHQAGFSSIDPLGKSLDDTFLQLRKPR